MKNLNSNSAIILNSPVSENHKMESSQRTTVFNGTGLRENKGQTRRARERLRDDSVLDICKGWNEDDWIVF